MGVSEFTAIILFVISCVSIIINVVTFVKNGNKDVKKDTSEDSYKWGRLDERLNNLEKQVNKILDKLDTFEIEVDEKIEKAFDEIGVKYVSLTNFDYLIEAASETGAIEADQIPFLKDWHAKLKAGEL